MKYTYKTIIDKKGNNIQYRCWKEIFHNEYIINRMKPIKINNEKVVWYPLSILSKMSKKQLQSINIK